MAADVIAIASDHAGIDAKDALKTVLTEWGYEVLGPRIPIPSTRSSTHLLRLYRHDQMRWRLHPPPYRVTSFQIITTLERLISNKLKFILYVDATYQLVSSIDI